MRFPPLPREFYLRDVHEVARGLLGKRLIRTSPAGRVSGRIVEVEAYQGSDDPASHAYRGERPRNRSMFGLGGHAYVYAIHSRWCLNVVTQPLGTAHAVLIRAVEPLEGLGLMARRRGREGLLELTRGPGRLCQAMAIERDDDGWDLTRGRRLWIADDVSLTADSVAISPRIGVTSAQKLPWRYFEAGSRFVSGSRRDHRSG
jgi:DNA-3-methyladenine glycosylase